MVASVNRVLLDQLRKGNKERLIARLVKHLEKRGQCWIWTGARNSDGYPKMNFAFKGRGHTQVYVHHVFFVLRTGRDIRKGMELDHKCLNRSCVWCTQEVTAKRNKQLAHERKTKKASIRPADEDACAIYG